MRRAGIAVLLLLICIMGCRSQPDSQVTGDKENKSPVAYIDSITPAVPGTGDTVSFSGHGEDADGIIVAFRWYSDLDGELSVKQDFQIESLSQGTHVISLKVQDNNGAWSKEANRALIVEAQVVPVPVITLFTTDSPDIMAGQSSLLRWEVSNADIVDIAPDIGTVSDTGTITVVPDTTTVYTLTASNEYGTVYTQLTVSIQGQEHLQGMQEIVLDTIPGEDGALIKYSASYEKRITPCAGDDIANLASRAFLSFDISSIPQNAKIEAAILDLTDCTLTGDPTYVRGRHGNMGALEVYHYQYGDYDSLDRSAYIRAAELTKNGSFQEYPLNPWRWDIKESDDGIPVIQELVQSGTARCQLRIQFFTSTNWDSVADMICFEHTTLTVRYSLP